MFKVHGDSDEPIIRADACAIEWHLIEDIEAEEADEYGFCDSFEYPCEKVFIVEDTIFLSDEVYLREESIKVFVDSESLG